MTQMTYQEFVESEEFENYVQDIEAWEELPPDLQAQVAGTGANILGIAIGNGQALKHLSLDTSKYEPWEAEYLDLHQRVFEAEQDRQLFNFTERAMPEFIKERLRDVILSGEAVFSQFDTLDSDKLQAFRTQLADGLTQDGWTIDDITGRITDIDSAITRNQAETIARTEVASAVNTAREEGYEETGMAEGEKFYWTGATQAEQPDRTTDACDWLIQKTNPNHGGEPVSMDRLKELIDEAPTHDDNMDDNLARPENFIVHPQERKTWVRAV